MENAKMTKQVELEEEFNKYLTIFQGNETYGIDVSNAKEIIDYCRVTKIPTAPQYIRGVINLRGEVVPLIDLSYRLYGIRNEITTNTCIVIVEVRYQNNAAMVGIMVDALNSVIDIALSNIEQRPDFGARIRSDYIAGVGKVDNMLIILLNIERVLDIEELSKFSDSDVLFSEKEAQCQETQ